MIGKRVSTRDCFIAALISMAAILFIVSSSIYPAYATGNPLEKVTPQEQLNQYISELQGRPWDTSLREKIIMHVQTMKPAPAIPDEAKRHTVRGMAAIEEAKTEADYKEAIAEFEKVVNAAPWLGEGYRNLGITQDKAGQYDAAIKNLNLYLLTNPADAEKAKSLIYKIEFRRDKVRDKAQKEAVASEEAKTAEKLRREEAKRAKLRELESWSGLWSLGRGSGGGMRWRVTSSGNTIDIAYYDSYNFKTERWGSNHPCPENWRGTISENLELSLTMFFPDSCRWTPRPPTMSWPVAGRIDFDKKKIIIDEGKTWSFTKGGWDYFTSTTGYRLMPDN